jgi:hypothetical protein
MPPGSRTRPKRLTLSAAPAVSQPSGRAGRCPRSDGAASGTTDQAARGESSADRWRRAGGGGPVEAGRWRRATVPDEAPPCRSVADRTRLLHDLDVGKRPQANPAVTHPPTTGTIPQLLSSSAPRRSGRLPGRTPGHQVETHGRTRAATAARTAPARHGPLCPRGEIPLRPRDAGHDRHGWGPFAVVAGGAGRGVCRRRFVVGGRGAGTRRSCSVPVGGCQGRRGSGQRRVPEANPQRPRPAAGRISRHSPLCLKAFRKRRLRQEHLYRLPQARHEGCQHQRRGAVILSLLRQRPRERNT